MSQAVWSVECGVVWSQEGHTFHPQDASRAGWTAHASSSPSAQSVAAILLLTRGLRVLPPEAVRLVRPQPLLEGPPEAIREDRLERLLLEPLPDLVPMPLRGKGRVQKGGLPHGAELTVKQT